MISAWTSNLKTEEEKEAFRKEVLGSRRVFKRLQELLKIEEDGLDQAELNTKIYDIPNWDYRQADMNGCRRMIRTVNKLINLDQEK
jgi:hypothetical protein